MASDDSSPPPPSVVIPTYNRARYLVGALDSVLAQDSRPLEVLVVDDGSSDGTADVVARQQPRFLAAGCPIRLVRQLHRGAAVARNHGVRAAKSPRVAFLDSDDFWRPRLLSTLGRLLDQHPTAALAFSGIQGVDHDDRVFAQRDNGLGPDPTAGLLPSPFERIIRKMPLQTSGVLARRSALLDAGGFDPTLPVVEDWDLWYRLAKQHDFAYTSEPLACNRWHPGNLPKTDVRALSSGLRMNLSHLPDVTEAASRSAIVRRIQGQMTLLQERLMAEGILPDAFDSLLPPDLAPRTMRYSISRLLLRKEPRHLGRAYASFLQRVGRLSRRFRQAVAAAAV